MYRSGMFVDRDGFDYILDWCKKKKTHAWLPKTQSLQKN